jgi:Tfp pilus assembly protein PilN
MCVVALAGYVLASNTVKERRAELASVTAEHQAAVRRAGELKPYGTFQAMATRRIEGVTALASQRFDWDRAFGDLARALPAEVTLEGISGSLAGGSGGGNALRGTVQAPAIEIRGCTRTHPGVAELMSRLRTIRGVTRVTLARSAKPEAAAAAPTADAKDANPCGKATAPRFEMVMFFERSTAGTAGAAASPPAAPGAAATPAPAGGQPAGAQASGTQPATGSAPAATPAPAAGQPAATPAGGTPTAAQPSSSATTTPASTPGATP